MTVYTVILSLDRTRLPLGQPRSRPAGRESKCYRHFGVFAPLLTGSERPGLPSVISLPRRSLSSPRWAYYIMHLLYRKSTQQRAFLPFPGSPVCAQILMAPDNDVIGRVCLTSTVVSSASLPGTAQVWRQATGTCRLGNRKAPRQMRRMQIGLHPPHALRPRQ